MSQGLITHRAKGIIKALLIAVLAVGAFLAFIRWRYAVPRPRERVRLGQYDDLTEREHVVRYEWARQFCKDKRVADIASGTGYGMRILAQVAASVEGYDREALGQRYVIDLDKQAWPEVYDVIVSFETIEHLANPDFFLGNIQRTCARLLLSTPIGERAGQNPFHKQVWTLDQIKELIGQRFDCEYSFQMGDTIGSVPLPRGFLIANCQPK